jgi:hypothetical protein
MHNVEFFNKTFIDLNNKNFFNKKFILKKERGDNILFGGGDGSAKSEVIIQFLYQMILQKQIYKSSINIDLIGDNSAFLKFISCLDEFNLTQKEDFFLFNSMSEEFYHSFSKLNFKASSIQNYLKDKHIFFNMPSLERCTSTLTDTVHSQIYNFINNLPVNKG